VALTAVSAAISGGSSWLNERLMGIVKEYLVAPIPRLSILLGHALGIVTQVLLQSLIIFIIGILMGARLGGNPLGWILGFLLIGGYGIGFSGLALAVASRTNSSGGYHMMIFLLQLPLLFWSNSLYPAFYAARLDAHRRLSQPDDLRRHRFARDDDGGGRARRRYAAALALYSRHCVLRRRRDVAGAAGV
jgi:ABC-type multidrug transport system permease subunit